jgi:Pyruvate/2-oxoacid:ferredoxin oxidoreductase delta subunit
MRGWGRVRRRAGREVCLDHAGCDDGVRLGEITLSRGNCFRCDNCYGVCLDSVVLKVDEAHGYAFDLDYRKGCGACSEQCPCGAIEMIGETI